MTDRLIADTNAIIDFIRPDRRIPPPLLSVKEIFVPLPAVGELFAGAHHSTSMEKNLQRVEYVLAMWPVLSPDIDTSRVYGRLRGNSARNRIGAALMNDLWIAALCIQHDLPLLTNDRGFDNIPELRTIHW